MFKPFDPLLALPQAIQDSDWARQGLQWGPNHFGGLEFTWEMRELGHLSADGTLALLLPAPLRALLLQEGKVSPYRLYPDSSYWVQYEVCGQSMVYPALWLLRLVWEYKRLSHSPRPWTAEARATALEGLKALKLPPRIGQVFEDLVRES
jgi:hypothetical protein